MAEVVTVTMTTRETIRKSIKSDLLDGGKVSSSDMKQVPYPAVHSLCMMFNGWDTSYSFVLLWLVE